MNFTTIIHNPLQLFHPLHKVSTYTRDRESTSQRFGIEKSIMVSPSSPWGPPVPAGYPVLNATASSSDDGTVSETSALQTSNILALPPRAVLLAFSAGMEALVALTGDVPLTPPPTGPTVPHTRGIERERQPIVLHSSQFTLSLSTQPIEGIRLRQPRQPNPPPQPPPASASTGNTQGPPPPPPYVVVGGNSQTLSLKHGNLQHICLIRRFYSKLAPPMTITAYLLRLHKECPMSAGVYLAASMYIYRLAVEEQAIAITKLNAHRLVLAGIRAAMKALEDEKYSTIALSKVGGISCDQLNRLETNFCYLVGFNLYANNEMLTDHWEILRAGAVAWVSSFGRPPQSFLNMREPPQDGRVQTTQGPVLPVAP